MNKKNVILSTVAIIIISFTYAQIPPPGSGGLPPDGIPIDGGLGLLLAGLATYGASKIWKKNK